MTELLHYLRNSFDIKNHLEMNAEVEWRKMFIDNAINNGRDKKPTHLYAEIDVTYTSNIQDEIVDEFNNQYIWEKVAYNERVKVTRVLLEVDQEKVEIESMEEVQTIFDNQMLR